MSQMAYENRNVSDDWVPVPGFNVVRACVCQSIRTAIDQH